MGPGPSCLGPPIPPGRSVAQIISPGPANRRHPAPSAAPPVRRAEALSSTQQGARPLSENSPSGTLPPSRKWMIRRHRMASASSVRFWTAIS